ncbi:uncharacterized protein LOC105841073 [Monomorium pharaonis]|uniref:uncharacterized protein LOC105841073 n=1 Tax=Monomorium pharaonis TaxID=307658 RepID=UPI00063F0D22|nr:uncharacterized protein LOC105841073 [Monomorium pharaonis]
MSLNQIHSQIEMQLALSEIIAGTYDNFMKTHVDDIPNKVIQARLTTLKDVWERFSAKHRAVGIAVAGLGPDEKREIQSHSYFTSNMFTSTYDHYTTCYERLTALLDEDQGGASSTSSSQLTASASSGLPAFFHQTRLPRFDLPKFNGAPSEWLPFKDLFCSLVINDASLSPVEKLQYLKTSLTGSAASLLKNTTIQAENFQKSWDALIAFYENKRVLVHAALNSLFSIRRMVKESAGELEKLYTLVLQIYRTLESLERPVYYWDDFLIFCIVERLDAESVKAWEQRLGSTKEPPTWTQFTDFLVSHLMTLKAYEGSCNTKIDLRSKGSAKSHYHGQSKSTSDISGRTCGICSKEHLISYCPQYTNKTVQQRLAIVKKHKRCYNCLGTHMLHRCQSIKRCLKCAGKHHTSLHRARPKEDSLAPAATGESPAITTGESPATATGESPATTSAHDAKVLHAAVNHSTLVTNILLATARVEITARNGRTSQTRVLIDQRSEVSLITERLAQRLRLTRTRSQIPLVGIGAQQTTRTNGLATFIVAPHFDSRFRCTVNAHILPKLTTSLPSAKIEPHQWQHLNGLNLADPNYQSPGPIDLILGADVYVHLIEEGVIKGPEGTPITQHTKLGWIVSGPVNNNAQPSVAYAYHVSHDNELCDLLRQFWTLEECPSSKQSPLSLEEQECENYFTTTYSRDIHGRYIVKLPFKKSPSLLGDSFTKAVGAVNRFFRQFDRNPEYAQAYSEFISEYARLQHMQLVSDDGALPPHSYYLPHHGVWKEHSSTTKLRVVFNGSSPTNTGHSLNDVLYTGHKLQNDLFDVLTWFRLFRYAFSTDVEKMYRQIRVHSDHWPYQRILWKLPEQGLCTYALTTVTYGLACSPYLSLRVFLQLLEDEGPRHPLAIPALKKGRYVDDIFGGSDTIKGATEITRQLTNLCMAGGFPLQKWISNHPAVLKAIPEDKQVSITPVNIDENFVIHTLGLSWQPVEDTFQFSLKPPDTSSVTKRTILSTIARLFDPLGFLSPVIITAKILMQELWTLKLDWDDPLPEFVNEQWVTFVQNLHDLQRLSFPRWVGYYSGCSAEIHGFCDASQKAIAAVVYLRVINEQEGVRITMVASKTKLVFHLLSTLDFEGIPIYLWTDSSITYLWISNHPSRWKDFVHNRVCLIQDTLPQARWKFVPGNENPADLATRGLTPIQLSELTLWWKGPHWLSRPSSEWPTLTQSPTPHTPLEERPVKANVVRETPELWDLVFKYSSLTRLLRITAFCQRAVSYFKRHPISPRSLALTTDEITNAKLFWIKTIQRAFFKPELDILS